MPANSSINPPQLADPAQVATQLEEAIQESVAAADAEGIVINLSGGIDSTVTATLAVRALGADSVSGLTLPADPNRTDNLDDARSVATDLGISFREIDIQPFVDECVRTVSTIRRDAPGDPLQDGTGTMTVPVKPREEYTTAVGNVAARLRMVLAYFEANTTRSIVLGTGNQSELLLGYFTKYGDGAADMHPIGDLYKTEVRQLARELGVPTRIIEKPPTAGLWADQTDEDELGADYKTIDTVLRGRIDHDVDRERLAKELGLPLDRIEELEDRVSATAHKRTTPPTATMLLDSWRPNRGRQSTQN